MLSPLSRLVSKTVKWKWTKIEQKAFDDGRWTNQELIMATDTNAWVAVYQLLGLPWKDRSKSFPTETTTKKTTQIKDFFNPKGKVLERDLSLNPVRFKKR